MQEFKNFITILKTKLNAESASELGWVFFGQGLSVTLGFIIIKIISKMGPGEYGVYALILTIAAFLWLIFGSFQQGFLRFYYHYENLGSGNVFVKLMYRFLKISVLGFILISIIISVISQNFNITYSVYFIFTAGLFVIFSKLSEFFNSILNLIRKRKQNSLLQAMERLLMIIALLIFYYTNNLKLFYVLASFSGITLFLAFLKLITFRKYLPKETIAGETKIKILHSEMIQTVFVYITPFLIWAIAGWLQMNGEKWIINDILSVKEVGIYAIMMSLVNAFVVIPNNIITEFSMPIIFKQYADMNNSENMQIGHTYIKINMALILGITFFATILTFIWGKEIITLISSGDYLLYWYLLPVLVLGTGMFYIGQAQTLLGLALSLPKKYLAPKLFVGISSVGANYFLVSKFGLDGISYSILLMGFIYLLYIAVVNKQILKHMNLKSRTTE